LVRAVEKKLYKNYLKKAEEMLDVAEYAANKSKNVSHQTVCGKD